MDRQDVLNFNETNIAEFRANHGTLSSFGDAPVLLLTAVGAKSGRKHTSPMMYLADDQHPNRVYVFASAAGADTNPAWFHNVVAHPNDLEIEIGQETLSGTAEVLPEPERAAVYAIQAGRYQGFAGYQAKTTRLIPVIALNLHR
jgi:deazaflavin-dependent oxidoreductase (nitroreductase family)